MTSQTTFTSCMHDQMLESNRDDVKLEAMRCVTVMTAKGKLSVPRTLFPHIVKNVSSKNPELKKLIYLYLTNFADQEPDLALLPVANLQKSLKSPNPLVRSSALKVLTSMRLNILSAILMATLRNSVNDLSPYVRKTVAHAIIKIYRLDPSLREDLIEYIERLFNDKNSMVLSSAVATFEVVCPEKLELVHKQFRRFCFILADCNEWGQTLLLNLLKRYVINTYNKAKMGDTTDYNPAEHDPKILLRAAKPLLHSNNSAVVMSVIKLFIAIANHNEIRSTITRPSIRLLYGHREIQVVVLKMIEELTTLKGDIIQESEAESDGEAGKESDDDETSSEKQEFKQDGCNNIVETALKFENNRHENELLGGEEKETQQVDNLEPPSDVEVIKNNEEEEKKSKPSIIEEDNQSKESGNAKEGATETGSSDESSEEDTDEENSEDDDSDDEDSSDDDDDDDDDDDEANDSEEKGENKETVKQVSNGALDKDEKKDYDFSSVCIKSKNEPSAYREVFRPYIKSFFVKHTDCTQVRLAKLKILTNLSSSVNVNLVLRELQAYISTYVDDKEFVSAAIHAIGRCAIIVHEVAQICLNGLTSLLSNNNEHVVSEAIVVLRSQIINKKPEKKSVHDDSCSGLENGGTNEKSEKSGNDGEQGDTAEDDDDQQDKESSDENDKIVSTVIKQVTRLLPRVTAPQARATILWILAEFCDKNLTAAKCTPEVLRSIAKSFCQEDNFVKLQSLTLASKFVLSLDKDKKADLYHKVHLLTGYLFSLAKYDINHDVRDRGRFLKKLLDDEVICSRVLN